LSTYRAKLALQNIEESKIKNPSKKIKKKPCSGERLNTYQILVDKLKKRNPSIKFKKLIMKYLYYI